jgi:uronate dehydrogenase
VSHRCNDQEQGVRVLVTGASGQIGAAFVEDGRGGDLELLRADLADRDRGSELPFLQLDVTDAEACREACRDIDAVLHLAADPRPDADFAEAVLPVNIGGTYNMAAAAVAAGVRRFVFASSAQAVEGYPLDRQVRETDAPWPANDYGAGKAFGEALCASLAVRSATSFVAVRIGNYSYEAPDPAASSLRDRAAWLSPRDATQLLTLALVQPSSGYLVAHGVSDNAVKRLAIDATRGSLGYRPQDDAFGADGRQQRGPRRTDP